MAEFWEFMKTVTICGTVLVALFLILVSFRNEFSAWSLRVYSLALWLLTIFLSIYILNPLDLVPDLIPILGQVDDAAALVGALMMGVMGVVAWVRSGSIFERLEKERPELPPHS